MIIFNYALQRTIVILVCFTFYSPIAHGQQSLSQPPAHAFKFSPLHLLNPELASVQLAYEYRFTEKFSVQVEGGYVFGDVWWSSASENAKGIKFKEDLRWYFYRKAFTNRFDNESQKGMYLAMEFHQNRMEFARDGYSPYRQVGQGIKTGFVRYSPWGLLFDVNFGFSLARTNMAPVGIPLNNYLEGRNGYAVVLPIIGFRLGYWLK